jgi:endonuclease-3 related protein
MPMRDLTALLMELYRALRDQFGHRNWWPGDSALEIMVGAVLTQRTSWRNVEKALEALKGAGALEPARLADMDPERMQELVRPAGYYRQKSSRLRRLAAWLVERTGGHVAGLEAISTDRLREELLGIRGIGPETADSILLYALGRPTFVVDTYTNRIAVRHGLLEPNCGYYALKELFEDHLSRDVELYRDYHAQLVEVGKRHCRPRPKCRGCPARKVLGEPLNDEELM